MHFTTAAFSALALAAGINAGTIGPTRTAASCTPTAVVPKPSTLVCNGHGSVTKEVAVRPSYPQQLANIDGCRDNCMADPQCISYAFQTTNSSCRLFSKPIIKQGYKRNPASTEIFYNRRCFKNSCSCDTQDFPDLCSDGYCYNFNDDDDHCGSCDVQCNTALFEYCDAGECKTPGPNVC